MAGSVVGAGLTEGVWPIGELGAAIVRRVAIGRPGWAPMFATNVAAGGSA